MWTVEIGAYSLKKGVPAPDVSRKHVDPVDALLDLEKAIETDEKHRRGWPMSSTYAIVAPDGARLALNAAYRRVFGLIVGCCGTCQKWRLRGGKVTGDLPGNCEHHPKQWTRRDTPCDCNGYVKWDTPNEDNAYPELRKAERKRP